MKGLDGAIRSSTVRSHGGGVVAELGLGLGEGRRRGEEKFPSSLRHHQRPPFSDPFLDLEVSINQQEKGGNGEKSKQEEDESISRKSLHRICEVLQRDRRDMATSEANPGSPPLPPRRRPLTPPPPPPPPLPIPRVRSKL
ncbi:uncharacterized protein A4U43_C01F18880 [Asparagus officinalis]|uniref:Uncharacterized protein n=1 Tax=Asparagus officinalis TaxID=4686 RepID=A0A5P1FR19_ASPOF|nr:uncharacterized protein A4U43_C01F18880 [Asparagus officinalis]